MMKRHFLTLSLCCLVSLLGNSSLSASITGQWDFTQGDLTATTGVELQYFDSPFGETAAQTVFGTTTELGLPDIGGQPAHVMGFPRSLPHMGYLMFPNMQPNGGGILVNQYTWILDILFPESSGNQWRALIQIDDPTNTNDADLFINPAGGIGISGQYQGTVQADTWHRLAFAFDLAHPDGPQLRKYIDGVLVGQQTLGSGIDGRWAMNPAGGMFGESVLVFTDDNLDGGHVQPGFVSSMQIHEVALSSAYIAALGAPESDAIPSAVTIPVTLISRIPGNNAVNVLPSSPVEIVLEPGSTPFQSASVALLLNDQPLTTSVQPVDGRFHVQATLPTLDARSENTLRLSYDDEAQGGEVSMEWTFRIAPYEDDPALEESLQQGLISYWKLDDGLTDDSASTLLDSVGPNHGTVTSSFVRDWWTIEPEARFGGALRIDGEDVYGFIPASPSLGINTDQVTLSLWVQFDQLPSELPEGFGGIYDSTQDSYVIYLDRGNRELRFKVTDTAGHAARPGVPESELNRNTWMHVVGVYDGRAGQGFGEARIYLNGTLMDVHTGDDGSPGTGLTANVLPGQVAALGRDGSVARYFLNCLVDDVAVWDRALSEDEVGYLAVGRAVPAQDTTPAPLGFARQPEGASVVEGATWVLRMEREGGLPPYSQQWLFNGTEIPDATDEVLFISAQPDRAGEYTVRIQDANETVTSDPATLTVAALPASPEESLSMGLVAHWPFDEDFTSRVPGFDGEPEGGVVIETGDARIGTGSARFYQSEQSYVRIPTRVIPDGAGSYTIAGWFHLDGGSGRRFLWETYPSNWAISTEIVAAGTLSFSMMQEDGHWQGQNTGITPTAGWHHVAVTYEGQAGELIFYLDGLESGRITLNPNKGTAITTGLHLGTFRGANDRFYEGRLDDVGVWNRVLLGEEIPFLAAGNGIPAPVQTGVVVESIQLEGNTLTLRWSGAHSSYQVQRRPQVHTGEWMNVGEPTAASEATDTITDTDMFYRVIGQ